jgi:hypothetical protein
MTHEEFLARLETITKGLGSGQQAQTAATTDPNATLGADGQPLTVLDKDQRVTPREERAKYVDPLRAIFEDLATIHKGYAPLGSERALEDPYAFIRRRRDPNDSNSPYAVPMRQVGGMISVALQKHAGKRGTPLSEWMGGRNDSAIGTALEKALSTGVFDDQTSVHLQRALETGGGSGGPLIRTDLDPLLREAYLRNFPALDLISTKPSNGLVHTYNVRTAVPDATILSELGDLNTADGNSTFVRKAMANIAVLARKTGISLKLQYATAQSGMGGAFDLTGPDNLEVAGAFTGLARKEQSQLFQGNFSGANDATLASEDGLYNADGMDGLRYILKDAATSINKGSASYIDTFNTGIAQIANAGGSIEEMVAFMSLGQRIKVNQEFQSVLRVTNATPQQGFPTNLSANGVILVGDVLSRFQNIPASTQGQGIGYYTYSAAATEDIYLADPAGMARVFLGSPTPVVLELPVGYNGSLSNVYIVFFMVGLMVDLPSFHRKIRAPRVVV